MGRESSVDYAKYLQDNQKPYVRWAEPLKTAVPKRKLHNVSEIFGVVCVEWNCTDGIDVHRHVNKEVRYE